MRVLITIQHGENVHLFKHVVDELAAADRTHRVKVCAREKEVNLALLDAYDIEYVALSDEPESLVGLATTQLEYELRLLRQARSFDPDVVLTSHGIAGPHVASLLGATSLNFVDTEAHIAAQHHLFVPFSDVIYTPDSLRSQFGDQQVRYRGLHELAYLRPGRFEPDPSILERYGVDPDEPFSIVRLNAWDAHHDIGKSGFEPGQIRELVTDLSEHGDVYLSQEGDRPDDVPGTDLPVPPEHVHHLMYYADLFVGDVSTMTVESAVLGTPTVRVSPFATERDMGKFRLLEDEYGLIRSFHTDQSDQALAVASALAADDGATAVWAQRRQTLLEETRDVTEFVLDALEEHASERETEHEQSQTQTQTQTQTPGRRVRAVAGHVASLLR